MKKPPKAALDPLKIFMHASRFHESDHRLRNTVPRDRPDQLPLVAQPAMVLSAFASELYLKCLLCIETGSVPNDHNLSKLFKKLSPAARRRLEELWDADIQRPERQKVMDHIRKLPDGAKLRLDLPNVLDLGALSFVELRYIYEGGGSFFVLGDFPNILRAVILERFPGWGQVVVNPPVVV